MPPADFAFRCDGVCVCEMYEQFDFDLFEILLLLLIIYYMYCRRIAMRFFFYCSDRHASRL